LTSTAAQAADLGIADLPRIHAEYKANQARWAREFLGKTFAATMTLGSVSNVFGNDSFMVMFLENPSDWLPGVACSEARASDFLISKNKLMARRRINQASNRFSQPAHRSASCLFSQPTPTEQATETSLGLLSRYFTRWLSPGRGLSFRL